MALNMKNQKEIEYDIHEQLYMNILILTFEYPTTKEFNSCFKKDMFVKNNKAAFQHVMHFLLNVLNPQLFKHRIMWPILDGKMETHFRTEVMKFINELNISNKETGIPLIMTSHLISPGGYKFAEFIFRLSQFVLLEHVKRNEGDNECIMFPPKTDNEYSNSLHQVSNWNKIVDGQISNLARKHMAFESKYIKAKQREKFIIEQTPIVQKSILDMEREISEFYAKTETIPQVTPEIEDIMEQKLDHIRNRTSTFEECCKLMDNLQEHDTNESESLNTGAQGNELSIENKQNLLTCLESFLEVLKTNKSAIKSGQYHHLSEHLTTCAHILEELNTCNNKYEEFASELQFYQSQLEETMANYTFSEESKNDSLSQKINEIFERIQSITITAHS